jgi:hypothetical protein
MGLVSAKARWVVNPRDAKNASIPRREKRVDLVDKPSAAPDSGIMQNPKHKLSTARVFGRATRATPKEALEWAALTVAAMWCTHPTHALRLLATPGHVCCGQCGKRV